MDTVDPARFLFAMLVVLGLIGLMAMGLRRAARAGYGSGMLQPSPQGGAGRLAVVETRYLDRSRRLVLVRRDDREHLLLLADGRELVVESDIPAKAEAPHA